MLHFDCNSIFIGNSYATLTRPQKVAKEHKRMLIHQTLNFLNRKVQFYALGKLIISAVVDFRLI